MKQLDKDNHETRLIDYLKKYKNITVQDASKKLGNFRLSASIKLLRNKGFNILTTWETAPNRYGETTRFGRYVLISTPEERK